MYKFRITRGLPIPRDNSGRVKASLDYKSIFKKLAVGDSFFIPYELNARTSCRTSAYQWGLRNGKEFVTREKSNGTRIWRVR